MTQYYAITLLFQSLSYPFLTIQRRLESRSKLAGFHPNEIYSRGRATSCLVSMVKQEGVLSLYKGYFANTLAIMLWMTLMPKVTNFLMDALPIFINPEQMR